MKTFLLALLSLPLAAQSLSLSCPAPQKFNQPAVCSIAFIGTASALQWNLTASPAIKLTVATNLPGKTLSSNNQTYILIGMNAIEISGSVATVTIPAHSGTVTLTLSGVIGSTSAGQAVAVSPAASVTVQ